MKKLSVLLIALILFSVCSACGSHKNSTQTTTITREKALEIALEKAGVAEGDIRDLDIELDQERGANVWEVDFDHGKLEYSYDIHAETGVITEVERERDN